MCTFSDPVTVARLAQPTVPGAGIMGSTLPSWYASCQYSGELDAEIAAEWGEFIQLGQIDLVTHESVRHYRICSRRLILGH